jgi:hypothetical protein
VFDFFTKDEARMADEEGTDPGQAFAALMSGAAKQAAPDAGEAPFGWMTDPDTGERRPKKALGRPRTSPSLDKLKAAKAEKEAAAQAAGEPVEPPEDRPPARTRRKHRSRGSDSPEKAEAEVPQHRPGVITKGVNRLYRKAGKIVKAMDRDIGIAIIESTKNTDEEGGDDSVGAAWEEVCRTNPRIRKFMLRLIAGGAWGQLLMAHAPILLAIIMKDSISKHIPFMKLLSALAEPDDDAPAEDKENALTKDDLQQMMATAQGLMATMGANAAAGGRRGPVQPEAA